MMKDNRKNDEICKRLFIVKNIKRIMPELNSLVYFAFFKNLFCHFYSKRNFVFYLFF